MAKLLQKYRKKSGLSQTKVAERMGLSKSSGFKYISWLETGRIKNVSIWTILLYLNACGTPWATFFGDLSAISFNMEHERVMAQVQIPAGISLRTRRKIGFDTAKYQYNIKYPKPPFIVDVELVKQKIENKVKIRCYDLKIKDDLIPLYLQFADDNQKI